MNIQPCFLSLIFLATIIFIHNLFLLRRCERLKHGQRCWKTQAEYRKYEADRYFEWFQQKVAQLTITGRKLKSYREKRDWLITQIWGSPTIVRDLRDVYSIICELRDKLAHSQRTSKGLANVIERQDAEVRRWTEQARANAEVVRALAENQWIVAVNDAGEWPFSIRERSGLTIGDGRTPEDAIAAALEKKAAFKLA